MTTEISLLAFAKHENDLESFIPYLTKTLKQNYGEKSIKVGKIGQNVTHGDFQCWININIPSESQAVESISEAEQR